MKYTTLIAAMLAAAFTASAAADSNPTLQQTAGIYYAYPGPADGAQAPVPDGYEPVYISHYGRHGSRWITSDDRYRHVMSPIDSLYDLGQLTPLGQDVRLRLHRVCDDAIGRSGSLSPVGERQHAGIARRMVLSHPTLFADSARVHAASSTSMRCAMSMAAFLEAMKELQPTLNVSRQAYERDMEYIAHMTPEGKAFNAPTAAWRNEWHIYEHLMTRPERLCASLINPEVELSPEQQFQLMMGLYWIASDMQDVDLDEDFYDIFTYQELENIWRTINARMYVCNGNAPIANGVMKNCAANLLANIIAGADEALQQGTPAANLRFGHDTHLLRLLTLIGLEGATGEETDMERYHTVWRDYELSPMAANLQLVLYRNAEGNVIAKFLLNENDARIPALDAVEAGPYYDWETLRAYLIGAMPAVQDGAVK